jgi:hypothetical protein
MPTPAATTAGGSAIAAPDVCNIPAPPPPAGPGGIPTPFINKADLSSATEVDGSVLFDGKKVVVESSKVPRTSGDEAGVSSLPTPKGVQTATNMGEATFKNPSSKVKVAGKGVIGLLAPTAHNGSGNKNMPAGSHVVPSQTKILIGM